jgi:predicted NAD-dependent protein-ADP-ribosyltransferase YbiA (DUF1768 family)
MSLISFESALKSYYQQTKDQKPEKKSLLVYDDKWKEVSLSNKISSTVLIKTMQKIVSLDLTSINENNLIYWIEQFNTAMSLDCLKNKRIVPVDASAEKIQFSSMNNYRWLSNFFQTLIYDPEYRVLYPSVENGYVAFKARKGGVAEDKVLEFAHLIGSKEVKQLGRDLWIRCTEDDDREAIQEMERLVSLKFSQNPFIARWLSKSSAPLEEFTNDPFWGSAMGTMGDDENSNHLGKILECVRKKALRVLS